MAWLANRSFRGGTGPPSPRLRWATFAYIHERGGGDIERMMAWPANRSSFRGGTGPPSPRLRWATFAYIHERRLVRKGGFEPPRSCERQPLKLVRLPVPPLPRGGELRTRYFGCAGAGVAGVCCAGALCAGVVGAGAAGAGCVAAGLGSGTELSTEPGPRWRTTDSASANTTNIVAQTQVTLVSKVAPVRAPNAAWLLPPPNAEAEIAPLALLNEHHEHQDEAGDNVKRRNEVIEHKDLHGPPRGTTGNP